MMHPPFTENADFLFFFEIRMLNVEFHKLTTTEQHKYVSELRNLSNWL